MASEFCANALSLNGVAMIGREEGIVEVVLGFVYLFMSVIIIYFIKIQERNARQGDDKAVKSVIFPIFVIVLWANAGINVYVGLIALTYSFRPYHVKPTVGLVFAIMFALQHCVTEGVAFLLMRKGVGTHAAKEALKRTVCWGILTFFIKILVYTQNNSGLAFFFELVWEVTLLLFYFWLWIAPQKRLFRRPAAINYGMFWFFFRVLALVSTIFYYIPGLFAAGNCLYVFGCLVPFALIEPFLIYYTLLQDSRWWQGIDIFQTRRNASAQEIKSPLLGMDLGLRSAQSLAASMDNMGLETSKGGKGVRLLNFAYITLDRNQTLGSGSFSKVYLGSYRGRKCAIKLVFTMDLTQDVIRRIAAEAQILSMFKHPNIVEIFGVSVLPPSVCILLELCAFGSLADVIKGTWSDTYSIMHHSFAGPSKLKISWADRLYLAVGCARGLVALHAFSPDLCHRDVKSFNFLVDNQLNAKISDLELGISKELGPLPTSKSPLNALKPSRLGGFISNRLFSSSAFSVSTSRSKDQTRDSMADVDELGLGEGVLGADDFLANWSAPEVIKDGIHCQGSDIYSLSLVLWEILSGQVPFSDVMKQDDIRFKVLSGLRPTLPSLPEKDTASPESIGFFHEYLDMITRGWAQEISNRPSAQDILTELESMWMGCCHSLFYETDVPILEIVSDGLQNSAVVARRPSLANFTAMNWSSIFPSASSQVLPSDSLYRILNGLQTESDNGFSSFESSPHPWLLVSCDSSQIVLYCTNSWLNLFNMTASEVLGKSFKDILVGPLTEIAARDSFIQSFTTHGSNKANISCSAEQTVLTLYFNSSANHAYNQNNDNEEHTNHSFPALYTLHGFPIFRKTIQTLSSNVSGRPPSGMSNNNNNSSNGRNLSIDSLIPSVGKKGFSVSNISSSVPLASTMLSLFDVGNDDNVNKASQPSDTNQEAINPLTSQSLSVVNSVNGGSGLHESTRSEDARSMDGDSIDSDLSSVDGNSNHGRILSKDKDYRSNQTSPSLSETINSNNNNKMKSPSSRNNSISSQSDRIKRKSSFFNYSRFSSLAASLGGSSAPQSKPIVAIAIQFNQLKELPWGAGNSSNANNNNNFGENNNNNNNNNGSTSRHSLALIDQAAASDRDQGKRLSEKMDSGFEGSSV
eukprot:gene4307-6103_t